MIKIIALAIAVLLIFTGTAIAATEEEIEQSIVNGTAWLATQQQSDGSWDGNSGITGLVLLKFIDRAKELGYDDPEDPEYAYSQNVIDGLGYLDPLLQDLDVPIGGYDGNGNGNMTRLGGTYTTGIAAMVYSTHPGTPPDLVQDLTDWLVNAQCNDGSWSYGGFSCIEGDNSNTGYATLGLGFAINASATIPDSTKTALSSYVDYIQNDPGVADDGTEDDPDGGSGYYSPDWWVNSLKTGNLIFEAVLSGDAPDTARILNATDYIDRHWNDDIEGWLGGHYPPYQPYNTQYQATFTIMKGLESIGLKDLNGIDWFDEMSTVIVADQQADGSWTGCSAYVWPYGDPVYYQPDELCTAWALLTLERVTPIKPIEIEGRMTGGGNTLLEDGTKVTHGFVLNCNATEKPNNLQVNWGKGNKFHLENIIGATCSDDPDIEPNPPIAGFDTYEGVGNGRYNGMPATIKWKFTDAGEPGTSDLVEIEIKDDDDIIVLSVIANLIKGNHQSHAV